MAKNSSMRWISSLAGILVLLSAAALIDSSPVSAAAPLVKTVPWVAANPLIPHDTWDGKLITLKGTCDRQGANFQYVWDFGDGSPEATGKIVDQYAIEARHIYSGTVGTVFTARLTVHDTSTGETANKPYFVVVREKSLPVEVNVAIDEGLWYLHKTQTRYASGGAEFGRWWESKYGGYATAGYYGLTAQNVNAFEVNGHLETGNPENPYVETVSRGLRQLFDWLTYSTTPVQTNPLGSFTPDGNGNGIKLFITQNRYYQGGMFMDAIIASGTPNAVAESGGANVLGRTYKEIVQDMVDEYAWAQYDLNPQGGGWRYNGNQAPDNSACQWAAIGIIPAVRKWGCALHPVVGPWNLVWLAYSQNPATGVFGYTNRNTAWGPYATTPSGMVQLAMNGVGRGAAGAPSWDAAETFIRDQWGSGSGATKNIKDYYYGLFSFVKAMLLHDSDGDGIAEPLQLLQSMTAGVGPIDWYASEGLDPSAPDSMDGVARTLVNDQSMGAPYWGYWWGHDATGAQYYFETAQAIMMLSRTVFESGAPVAVAKAVPNPAVVGQTVTLDGSASFHQDAAKTIDSWEWDLDADGVFDDAIGPVAASSFPALGSYPVSLRVTDNASPEASAVTTIRVVVSVPPLAPTADANGPYSLCPAETPWFMDGSGSVNPDEGAGEPGRPGDTIREYAWDLDGDGVFDDAVGPTPDVTAFFTAKGPGGYLIQLRVTDTTATSFPSSGMEDQSSLDSAQVLVRIETDPFCDCIYDLAARAKQNKIQLTWTHTGADRYHVYRGTTLGGPYEKIAETNSTYSTYLDRAVAEDIIYYYVVRPVKENNAETCQSNEASARPIAR